MIAKMQSAHRGVEGLAGSTQPRSDRPRWNVEYIRDLGSRHFFHLDQHEYCALILGERVKCFVKQPTGVS